MGCLGHSYNICAMAGQAALFGQGYSVFNIGSRFGVFNLLLACISSNYFFKMFCE